MIYGFVRQSGGQVRIYLEVGQGTTMCLYLQRLIATGETAGRDEPALARLRPEQGLTVLLVEDESSIRELVAEVLGEAGYRVLTAVTGPQGVAVLQSAERIDLLITDVGLPGGLNGRQVADAGRVVRPGLKVLFVTGYAANAAVGAGHLDEGIRADETVQHHRARATGQRGSSSLNDAWYPRPRTDVSTEKYKIMISNLQR